MSPARPCVTPPQPKWIRTSGAAALSALTVFLWLWTSGIYSQSLPRLGVSARAMGVSVSAIASDDGVHFRFAKEFGSRPELRWCDFNRPSYHHGLVFNLLGIIVAAQPYTYNGGDYIISPNAGISLPYWLLLATIGYGVLRWSGLLRLLAPYCRFGIPALVVMSIVGLTFLGLNVIPHANYAAARIFDPGVSSAQRAGEWVRAIFDPASLGDIELNYGFPFCCYEVGFINGQRVELYYGAEMEFLQHRLGENICVALAAMALAGMAAQWIWPLRTRPAA